MIDNFKVKLMRTQNIDKKFISDVNGIYQKRYRAKWSELTCEIPELVIEFRNG